MLNYYELLLGGFEKIKDYNTNEHYKENLTYLIIKSIGEEKINSIISKSLEQQNVNSFIFNLFNTIKNGTDLEKSLWHCYELFGSSNVKMPLEFIFYINQNKEDMKEYSSEEILEYYFFDFFEN